ncbi:MAG: hypothetical protein AAFU67_04935 [Bacteroidota bacterium]
MKNLSLLGSSLLCATLLLNILSCGSTNQSNKASSSQPSIGQTQERVASDTSRIAPVDSLVRREAPRPGTPGGGEQSSQPQKKRKKDGK